MNTTEIDVKTLFETGVVVAPSTPDWSSLELPTRAAVARVIGERPQAVTIQQAFGRVVVVNVTPRRVVDPPIPVILGWMPTGYHWAMRRWWRALVRYIDGWPIVGQVERRARVVLSALDELRADEREFFTQALFAATLGDAR